MESDISRRVDEIIEKLTTLTVAIAGIDAALKGNGSGVGIFSRLGRLEGTVDEHSHYIAQHTDYTTYIDTKITELVDRPRNRALRRRDVIILILGLLGGAGAVMGVIKAIVSLTTGGGG